MRRVTRAAPGFIPPQKATLVDRPPAGDAWLHEMKFDGYRTELLLRGKTVTLFSSSGLDWTHRFAAIGDLARQLKAKSALLDGEIVVMNAEGVSDFGALQEALSAGRSDRLTYWAFDLLELDGKSLLRTPIEQRKEALKRLLDPLAGTRLRYSEHVIGQGREFFAAAQRMGLEGIVSKRRGAPYVSGYSDQVLKIKNYMRQEFVIGGWTRSTSGWFGSLLVGVYTDAGELVYAGHVGTGFNQDTAADLMQRMRPLEIDSATLKAVPRRHAREAVWVRPELVCEVQFAEWTKGDNVLRHPSFKGLREDKDPKLIRREIPRRS